MTRIRGDIGRHTSLYRYLKDRGLWRATHISRDPDLNAIKLGGSHDVYLVEDDRSHQKFVLKSFEKHGASTPETVERMEKEYSRLKWAGRILGRRGWARVARPYYKNDRGDFLAEQYVGGTPLGSYVRGAIEKGKKGELYDKLTYLSGFLAILHKNTRKKDRIGLASIGGEIKRHARQAGRGGALTPAELKDMDRLVDRACSSGAIRSAHKALVHGDTNPSNFLYRPGRMYVIDMESSRFMDPVYDLGMMAGELFHFAMRYGGDPYKADPFIGHLYWVYAGNFKDQLGTFIRLTKRNPLYMANSLLRIARHPFFSTEYKRRLAYHAGECLKSMKNLHK
jgi:aminoglycoside phosphotransferase (APT) family kinase protein